MSLLMHKIRKPLRMVLNKISCKLIHYSCKGLRRYAKLQPFHEKRIDASIIVRERSRPRSNFRGTGAPNTPVTEEA